MLLVNHKNIASSVEADVVEKLPEDFRRSLAKNQLKLLVVEFSIVDDLDAVSESTKGFSADLAQIAFWKAALPVLGAYVINKLLQANDNGFELLTAVLDIFVATAEEKQALKSVSVLSKRAQVPDAEKSRVVQQDKPVDKAAMTAPTAGGPADNASFFLRKPSSPTHVCSHPRPRSLHTGVSDLVVNVQENKHLTRAEYDRYIFHIKFDITGTGLKYEIGESLGIHGRNNSDVVEEFLQSYGVDGDSLVEVSN